MDLIKDIFNYCKIRLLFEPEGLKKVMNTCIWETKTSAPSSLNYVSVKIK